jgi:hypothetical protein
VPLTLQRIAYFSVAQPVVKNEESATLPVYGSGSNLLHDRFR